jgi:hypothetical protein
MNEITQLKYLLTLAFLSIFAVSINSFLNTLQLHHP